MSRHRLHRPPTSAGRRRFSLVAVLTVLAGMLTVSTLPSVAPPAAATLRQGFVASYNAQTNGAIAVVGNSQMSCPTSDSTCATARAASPAVGTNTTYVNNNYAMAFLDVDGDATTSNSTTADLTVPAGSTVQYALLTWGARQAGATGLTNPAAAKFKAPGDTSYRSVTGTTYNVPDLSQTPYYTYLDVTSIVRAAGNGTYAVADLTGRTGADMYAGWSLTVVYSNPAFPLRDLRVYQGFADVSSGNPVDIPINGLLTPPSGAVNASVGFVAWEGDSGYQGDQASLVNNNVVTPLSDATRPVTNFFDSAISDLGVINTSRNPAYRNSLGVDIGRIDATGLIPNSATTTTLRVSSTQDVYYPTQITTQIDLYTPRFNPVSKTVTNLSGHSPAQVGDVLQYDLTFTNTGDDFADNVVVNDVLQANQTYVPGSLTVAAGTGVGPQTDATGDDIGEYLSGSRTVRFRVGTGANATTGGSLGPNATSSLSFRTTVDRSASGSSIPNTPTLDYTARAINNRYTYTGNTVTTPVRALADLAITKTATTTQTAGRNITYSLAVTDNGPSDATDVVVTDVLPAGVGYVSSSPPAGASCTFAGGTVTCTAATVANGTTLTIPITVSIPPGGAASALTNTASVSSSTADDVTTNNSASAVTVVTRLADVALTKTAPTSVVPGQTITYTLTATNSGPSTAEGVTVVDQLPTGLTYVPGSSSANCSLVGSTVTCTAGTLAVGGQATFTLVATVGSNLATGTLTNTATASTTTPESSTANNTSTANTTLAPRADVQIVKTIAASPAVAGRQSVYTLTIVNTGPSDAQNVTAADTLPTSFGITGVSTTSGNCTVTGQTVSCSFGAVAPNQPIAVTIRGLVNAAATGTLANTATVTSDTTDPTPGNNTSSTSTPITAVADLALVKSSTPGTITFGSPVTYSLTASNAGPSVATGTVTSDPLPTGFTFASSVDNCTLGANNTVTCPVGTLAVGASRTVTFVANTPANGDGTTVNTATVSSNATDPVLANNTASSRADGTAVSDLSVQKTTVTAVPESGGTIQYQVAVTNNGPSDAAGVVMTDPLPAGITFASATTDTGVVCTAPGGTVTCTIGTLANRATTTVTINATIGNNTRNTSTNTATVSSTTTDPSQGNNSSSSTVQVRAVADVQVTLVPERTNYIAGQIVDYVLTVRNVGPATSNGVVVTGSVPPGMTPILGSSGGACSVSGGTVTCNLGNLPAGAVLQIPLRAQIDPQTPAGQIQGTATVGSTTFDPVPANNTSTSTITVSTEAQLSIDKSVTPSPLTPGGPGVYQITVSNTGPSDAVNPVVRDTLNAALAAGTPSTTIGSCTRTGQAISCTANRLAAGQSMVVRIPVTVDPQATAAIANTATISSDTTDPTPGDNSVTISTPLAPSADLTLVKTADRTELVAGSTVTYTLTLTNAGPSDSLASTLTDTLPAGMTVLPGGVSGPAGACSVTADSRTVNCSLGTLAPRQFVVVTVEALVPSTQAAGSTLANTAIAGSNTSDPDGTNNRSTLSLPVATSADVRITKRTATDTFVAGAQGTYVLSVRNNGPSLARSVVVSDPLPSGTTFVGATTSAGTCGAAGGTLSCDLGDLDAGDNITVQVDVAVADSIAGTSLVNTATAGSAPATGSATPDPSTGNNSSTATVPVVAVTDLSLTKVRTSGPVVAGANVTYRITVENAGPSVSTNTIISDPIPAGTTYVSATPSGDGTCTLTAGVVNCSWAAIEVTGSRFVDVVVAVPTTAVIGADLTNTATANSDGNDRTPPSATDTSPVTAAADLTTVKRLISQTPTAGGTIRWSITVSNAGPSIATGTTVTDTVPTGVTLTGTPTSSQGSCSVAGGEISCGVGSVVPGTPVVITVAGTVDPAFTGTTITNSATARSAVTDRNPDDNTGSVTSSVTTSADLSISKTGAPAQLTAGSQVTWTIDVSNAVGPSAARSVVVNDTLPTGVTGVSATVPGGSCSVTQGVLTCSVPVIAFGATARIQVSGTVRSSYTGTSLDNTATVRANTPDPNGGNNSADSTNPVRTVADLAVEVTGPSTAVPGNPVSYSVSVTNNGPSDSSGASITVTLPAGLLNPQVTGPGGACTVTGTTAVCPLGTLPKGDVATISVTGTVDPGATGSIIVGAQSSGGTTDPIGTNNADDATTTLTPSADLSVTKRLVGSAVAGETVEWVLDYRNDGPSTARSVVITDQLPAGISNVTATVGATACTVTGTAVRCELGDLPPSAPGQVLVRGTLAADYAQQTLVNSAVIGSPTTNDPDTDDNTGTSTSTVQRSADLQVGKRITSGTPVAGAPITFEVTVKNNGSSVSTGTTLLDSVPAVVAGVAATTNQGSCTVVGQEVSCDLGTLTVDQTVTVTISGTLTQAFGTTVSNTATAGSDVFDPITTNNVSTATGGVDDVADLELTKTGPATITAGSQISWTLTIDNNGPSDARDVTVADTIPNGVSNVRVSPNNGAVCADPANCVLGSIPANGSVVVTVAGTVASDYTGASISNAATVRTASNDPDGVNNSDTARTDVTRATTLTVSKTVTPDPLIPGSAAEYVITVANTGPSDSPASVLDTLPAGLTIRDPGPTPSAGSCQVSGPLVDCALGTIAAGRDATVRIPVALDAAYTATTISNTAIASTPYGPDASGTSDADVTPEADLTVVKTGPASVRAGQPIAWNVTVSNSGPSVASAVVFTDTLPTGILDPAVTTSNGTCTITGADIRCELGDIAVGDPATVTIGITGQVDPSFTGGTLANTASVTSPTPEPPNPGGPGAPPAPSGRDSTATTTVSRSADVQVFKTTSTPASAPGEPVAWTIAVRNNGPSTATTVVVRDTLPDGLTGVQFTPPAGTTCAPAVNGTVECTIGTLLPGADQQVEIAVSATVDPSVTATSLVNRATSPAETIDPVPGNNTDESTVSLVPRADLAISKSAEPATAGGSAGWTISVVNGGPSVARDVVINDPLPAGVTDVRVTAPAGVTCTVTDAGGSSTVTCRIGALPPGTADRVTIGITARVSPGTTGDLTNTATVSSSTPDANTDDNTATATTPVGVRAGVSVTKTGPASVPAGGQVRWTVTVRGEGPATARGVRLQDPAPAGLTDVSYTPSTGTCTDAGVCELGDVAPGQQVTVIVTATVPADFAPDEVTNTATVTSTTTDPDPSDNEASATSSIDKRSDLVLSKRALEKEITAGGTVTWLITVTNRGPAADPDVTVVDRLPAGLTATDPLPAGCTVNGQTLTCAVGALANGESIELRIVTKVAEDLAGAVVNDAEVSGGGTDPRPGSNDGGGSVTVLPPTGPTPTGPTLPTQPTAPTSTGGTSTVTPTSDTTGPAPTAPTTGANPPGLPNTGAPVSAMLWWALGLLLAGAGLVLIQRRRRQL